MSQQTNRISLDRTKLLGFRLEGTSAEQGKTPSAKMGAKFGTKAGAKVGGKPVVGPARV